MRILLVTLHENLSFAITQVLNPANEYCAIVTDEVEPVKNFVKSVGGSENMVYPFHDLKECLENLYYDFVLCISDGRNAWEANKDFLKYKLPNDKYVNVCFSGGTCNGFINERTLRYYKLHAAEFEMFATGICYIGMGLDVTKFKYKLFNFGRSGNDLYYDYQTAKFALECAGGGYRFDMRLSAWLLTLFIGICQNLWGDLRIFSNTELSKICTIFGCL